MPRKQKHRKKYAFPILKSKQIAMCMGELGIVLDENDLNDPREDRFKFIYASILEKLLKVDLSQDKAVSMDSLRSHFEYPELHEKSVTQIKLMRSLIRFMQRVGVRDFCLTDLISPEKARTIRNLSAIINFAKFRNQKWHLYESKRAEEKHVLAEFQRLQTLNQELGNEFVRLQQLKKAQEPEVEALQREIAEVAAQIAADMTRANATRDEIHAVKKKIAANKLAVSERTLQLNTRLDHIRKLESQVVQNPQKLKKRLADMTREVQRRQIEMQAVTAQVRTLETRHRALHTFNTQLAATCETMAEVDTLKQDCHAAKKHTEQMIGERKLQQHAVKKACHELEQLQKRLHVEKQRFSSLEKKNFDVKQEIKHKLAQLQERRAQTESDNNNYSRQIEQEQVKLEAVQQAIADCKQKLEFKVGEVEKQMRRVMQRMEVYHEMISRGAQGWTAGIK